MSRSVVIVLSLLATAAISSTSSFAQTLVPGSAQVEQAAPAPQLQGEWVGFAEKDGDLTYLRIEFVLQDQQLQLIVRSMLPGKAGSTVPVQHDGTQTTFTLRLATKALSFTGRVQGEVYSGAVQADDGSGAFEFRRKAAIDERLYDEYAGAYDVGANRTIFVRRADRLSSDPPSAVQRSWLYWMDEAGNIRVLVPSTATTFFSGPTYSVPVPPQVEMEFLRDAHGTVNSLIFRENGKPPLRGQRSRMYSEEEVRFSNGSASLAGRLLLPAGAGPFPAVVVIHGGGPANRNWEYEIIGDVLAKNGIAALVYDKRGTGGSTGDWHSTSLQDLAADAAAAASLLRRRPDIHPQRVGFWGISEGGWVGPIAAANAEAAFLILISAPGLSHANLEFVSWESILREQKVSAEQMRAAKGLAAAMMKFARTKDGWKEVSYLMDKARTQEWFWSTEAGAFNPTSKEHWFWTWYRLQLDFDPQRTLQSLRCPVLAIYGAKDTSIPEVNKKRLEGALRKGKNPDYTVRVFPDADHTMLEVRSGALKDFPRIRRHVPEYFETVIQWIRQRVVDTAVTPGSWNKDK